MKKQEGPVSPHPAISTAKGCSLDSGTWIDESKIVRLMGLAGQCILSLPI
jgi:hypothetical protein